MKKLIIIILSIVFSLALFITLPWAIMFIGLNSLPAPPRPEIKYGEFPFRLEYEINGKHEFIEDTLICEYDGIGVNEGQGKYRKWKEHLASGNERVTLLKISDMQVVYFPVGSAAYYMGDDKDAPRLFPDAAEFETDGRFTSDGIVFADELFEKYNIKLISFNFSDPITNTFK